MKKILFFAIASASVLAISCQKEFNSNEVQVPSKGRVVTLSASVDALKTTYKDDKTFSWVAGDKISVMVSNGDTTKAVTFRTEQTGATAYFVGTLEDGYEFTGKAFYPVDLEPEMDGDSYVVTLTESIDPNNPLSCIPLVGELDGNTLYFHTAVGVMKFTVNNIADIGYWFTLYTSEPVAGTFKVSEDGLIEMADYQGKESSYYMIYSKISSTDQTFYFPIPVGTLNAGYEVTVESQYSTAYPLELVGNMDIQIAANSLTEVKPITCPDYEPPYDITLREDWTGTFDEDGILTVECDASYFCYGIFYAEGVDEVSAANKINSVSEEIVLYMNYGYTPDELVGYNYLYNTSPYSDIIGEWLPEGDFYCCIVGFDEKGNLTGEYGEFYFSNPPVATTETSTATLSKSPKTQTRFPENLLKSAKLPSLEKMSR